MKTKNLLILFSLALLGLSSCIREDSDAVDQDRIFTEYELFYDANSDKTFARATFKFSNIFGTKLELVSPSTVTFNGEILTFNAVLAYYEKEYAGLVDNGTFQWTDTQGNTFTNSINFTSIDYPDGITSISRDESFELNWEGSALMEKENVTLVINGENELDAQTFFTNDIDAQSIILDKSKLERLGAGEGTVFMDRRKQPDLVEKTNAGGIIIGRYRPENLSVMIE